MRQKPDARACRLVNNPGQFVRANPTNPKISFTQHLRRATFSFPVVASARADGYNSNACLYLPTISPDDPAARNCLVKNLRFVGLLSSAGMAMMAIGCSESPPAKPASQTAPAADSVLTAEAITVQPRAWPTIVRVQGGFVADEVTVVGAIVAGRVKDVYFDLGDPVPARAPLVTLDQTDFELQVAQSQASLFQARAAIGLPADDTDVIPIPEKSPAVLEAKAVWDEAIARRNRLLRLREQNAVTGEEFDQAIAAEKVGEARYSSALNGANEKVAIIQVRAADLAVAQQQLADSVSYSPFAAIVQHRHVAPGTYVQVGQPLLTLVRTNVLRFRGSMPERHAQHLRHGQQVRLFIASMPEPVAAIVSRISPTIDPISRALTFEVDVDNRDGDLRSGMFAEAEVIVDPTATSLVLHRRAVLEFAGVEKVWKLVDNVAREQVVQTGQRRADEVEILAGLQVGDVVLTDARLGRAGRVEPTLVDQRPQPHAAPPVASTRRDPTSPADESSTQHELNGG
jgi:RND family efflux transporter MFP subunit